LIKHLILNSKCDTINYELKGEQLQAANSINH
jgi:hypothetical protein